jgi:C4-dicarboxylate transporter DctQ subunit
LIFLSVLYRYSSGFPWIWQYTQHISFTWAQELSIYLLIWMAKFGASYGVRVGAHIGVDVLVRKLPKDWQHRFTMFGCFGGAFFTFVVAILGTRFVFFMYSTGQSSPDMQMPMWIVYLAIPVASTMMSYRFLQLAFKTHKLRMMEHYE